MVPATVQGRWPNVSRPLGLFNQGRASDEGAVTLHEHILALWQKRCSHATTAAQPPDVVIHLGRAQPSCAAGRGGLAYREATDIDRYEMLAVRRRSRLIPGSTNSASIEGGVLATGKHLTAHRRERGKSKPAIRALQPVPFSRVVAGLKTDPSRVGPGSVLHPRSLAHAGWS